MRTSRRFRGFLCVLACTLAVAGCAKKSEEDAMMKRVLEVPPVTDVPGVFPYALVDKNGYSTGGEKIVVFRKGQTGDTFEVRSVTDDAVVYTGSIRKKDAGESGVTFGQFGSFQTTGSYYIYTEATGSSYAFLIDDAIPSRLIHDALHAFLLLRGGTERAEGWVTDLDGTRDAAKGSFALCDLLLAYRIHEEAFDDAADRKDSGNGIPDLLDEACVEAKWLASLSPATQEEGIAIACALAGFSKVYAEYDSALSDSCFAAAVKAWNDAASRGTLMSRADAFAAAGALYDLTGEKTYENVLSAWFSRDDFVTRFAEDEQIFYGSVLYLWTRQPVNVQVRNTISDALLSSAKQIAEQAEASLFFVSNEEADNLLRDMKYLSVANFVSYNHAYNGILENHIHYLSGRNAEAVNDLEEGRIFSDCENLAKLMLLLGAY